MDEIDPTCLVNTTADAETAAEALGLLDASTRADTIVLVTLVSGGGFIFCDPDPLGSECPPI